MLPWQPGREQSRPVGNGSLQVAAVVAQWCTFQTNFGYFHQFQERCFESSQRASPVIYRDVYYVGFIYNADRHNGHPATTVSCGKRLHLVYNPWTASKFMDGNTQFLPLEKESYHTIYWLPDESSVGSNILTNLWEFSKRRFDFKCDELSFLVELSHQREFLRLELELDSSWSKEMFAEPCKV